MDEKTAAAMEGYAARKAGNYTGALAIFLRLAESDLPVAGLVSMSLEVADLHGNLGHVSDAVRWYDRAIELERTVRWYDKKGIEHRGNEGRSSATARKAAYLARSRRLRDDQTLEEDLDPGMAARLSRVFARNNWPVVHWAWAVVPIIVGLIIVGLIIIARR